MTIARTTAFALFLALLCSSARAAVIYEQPLAEWSSGWCSPCNIPGIEYRMFASFTLGEAATLAGGAFAVLDPSHAGRDDINISIWDAPFGNRLYSKDFAEGAYERRGNESRHFAVVAFDDWTLGVGSYWVSLFGINGNHINWGGDARGGSDALYRNGSSWATAHYVGFSLEGKESGQTPVPLPGTLGLLLVGLVALLATRRRGPAAH